jgi:MerR family transcriptional regulator, copper efflux regulator
MTERGMNIGLAAKRAGVNLRTLHYYERRGLLDSRRSTSNYRIYDDDSVARVRFIKRAQELGFTLEEIRELLELRLDSDATCCDVRERAEDKLVHIKEKIRSLHSMQLSLERLIAACSGEGAVTECPILESLDRTGIADES